MKWIGLIALITLYMFHCDAVTDDVSMATASVLHELSQGSLTYVGKFVYVSAQMETELEIVPTLWNNLIPTRSFVGKEWEDFMEEFGSYRNSWTHVIIGEPQWIIKEMRKAVSFVESNIMNIQQTQMVLIPVGGVENSLSQGLSQGGLTEQLNVVVLEPDRLFFKRKRVMTEIMERSVVITACRWTPGGEILLAKIGSWSSVKGLQLSQPIFERSLSDFGMREIFLSVVNKPRVFELYDDQGRFHESFDNMTGYVRDICHLLSRRLHMTPRTLPTTGFGARPYPNGSWPGMMGLVTSGRAQLAPLDFVITWNRFLVADFSVYIGEDNVLLISQGPRPLSQPFLLLQVFQPLSWAALVLSTIGCGTITFLLQRVMENVNPDDKPFSLYASMDGAYKIFLSQSSVKYPKSTSGKLFVTLVLLVGIIIISLYKGSIVSYRAVPKRTKPIDSADDLMANLDTVTPIARRGTVYYLFLQEFERYSDIASNLLLHDSSFLNTWDFFSKIDDKAYVLIDTVSSALGRVALFETKGTECKFHVSQSPVTNDWDYMVHQRNSLFRYRIDLTLTRMREGGIIDKIRSGHYAKSCEKPSGRLKLEPFSLFQVQGAFYVLVCGLAVSVIGFFVEFCAYSLSQKRQKIQS